MCINTIKINAHYIKMVEKHSTTMRTLKEDWLPPNYFLKLYSNAIKWTRRVKIERILESIDEIVAYTKIETDVNFPFIKINEINDFKFNIENQKGSKDINLPKNNENK